MKIVSGTNFLNYGVKAKVQGQICPKSYINRNKISINQTTVTIFVITKYFGVENLSSMASG